MFGDSSCTIELCNDQLDAQYDYCFFIGTSVLGEKAEDGPTQQHETRKVQDVFLHKEMRGPHGPHTDKNSCSTNTVSYLVMMGKFFYNPSKWHKIAL